MEEKNFENIRNNLERLLSPHKLPNLNLRNQSPDQDYKKTHKIRFFQHRLTKYDPIFSDHLPFIPKTSHHRRESENFNTRKFKKQTPDLFNSSFKDELKFALKHISMSPKKESKREKNVNITRSPTKFRGVEDTELGNFIQAMFSNEPSPFRKSELLIEPESIDIRAAEKLLQEANKIVKNGIKKKRGQQEIGGAIEEF